VVNVQLELKLFNQCKKNCQHCIYWGVSMNRQFMVLK